MEITKVTVRKTELHNALKAFVSIVIDDCFIVKDLKVIDGSNGIFVAMPSKKLDKGGFEDVAHPLNKETHAMITKIVLEEYGDGNKKD